VPHARNLEIGQRGRTARALLREHHLKERITAEIPLGIEFLDQLLERQVLMRERVERALARAGVSRQSGCPKDCRATPAC
jgi:hypothetical protein